MNDFRRVSEKLTRSTQVAALGAELNDAIRSLGVLERRKRIEEADGLRLADLIVTLESVKSRLGTVRNKAAGGDLAASMILKDVDLIEREADAKLKSYCGHIGSYEPYIDRLRWARGLLAASKKPKPKATRPQAKRQMVILKGTTKLLRRKSAEGKPIIQGVASSDSTDLSREFFTHDALASMQRDLRGKTCFLNHSYRVPDDVAGKFIQTGIRRQGGTEYLDVEIAVETSNPRAVAAYEMVQNGVRLGISVGVLVEEFRDDPDGRRALTKVKGLEASLVGIPSNHLDAWVTGSKSKAPGRRMTIDNVVVA